ncbi:MAG: hypothetical protein DFNUSKGM_001335 [Candidatus Fervidibacter sacchari]|jgi:hypothetical protein
MDRLTTCEGVDSKFTGTLLPVVRVAETRTAFNDPTTIFHDTQPVCNYTVVETPCKGLFGHIDTDQ